MLDEEVVLNWSKFNGKRLRDLRFRQGWTLQDASKKIGAAIPTIANWESGRSKPHVHACHKLAKLFGVTLESLFEQDEEVVKMLESRRKRK